MLATDVTKNSYTHVDYIYIVTFIAEAEHMCALLTVVPLNTNGLKTFFTTQNPPTRNFICIQAVQIPITILFGKKAWTQGELYSESVTVFIDLRRNFKMTLLFSC